MKLKSKGPSERHIQATCDDFLALDGWRKIVTDPPHMRGLGVTERGIADGLYIRYEWNTLKSGVAPLPLSEDHHPSAQVLWIEWKKKGGKAQQHQKDWHMAERARGALVWVSGEDFTATIEAFQQHYRESGLMRRKI